ncbi:MULTISPECIES: hypothetical protein [unclassified Mesorhizobium]|uniref:ComEC/Rec2 family competence protein n=1 Tax=unclassified Mesorhizobium TaxID=325217 RepID=UPI00112C7945|nr:MULTISPECIES: hypothetical protein [unclassified Mesorhizobium]MBZ9974200.1 hypothetical protein [Mesorhizobium sp. BR-1-1-10]TPK10300.1 hypothetical protein FJ543_22545 [Mesorhizobium sp. B2-5-7]
MDLKIFDVQHGACALLTCDDDTRMMIDCGQNAVTGWRPGSYLRHLGISYLEMLAITNYDEDHVDGLPDLRKSVEIGWLWRNKKVSARQIRNLKSEDGMGPGIDELVYMIEREYSGSVPSPGPKFLDLRSTAFSNSTKDFDDENNLSMALHLSCHGVGIMFPGDLETTGWLALLRDENFRSALRNTHVLIASHHGRESGICPEIFDYCSPYFIVISDKGYMYDTQRTIPYYRTKARGAAFRDESFRRVLTTRRDGRIGFTFSPRGWGAY